MENKAIYFFIGTEAELIKVFPVILSCKEREVPFRIISSGQNNINNSHIFKQINCTIDLELSDEDKIKKNAVGLLFWYIKTICLARKKIKSFFAQDDLRDAIMVVHGDTVSTIMGARLGKKFKMNVAHIEAGLRSHNLFNPFPEELDRLIVSRHAQYHFAPCEEACKNLIGRDNVINTFLNTLYDSLIYSMRIPCENDLVNSLHQKKYFVLVLHRQENLMQRALVEAIIKSVNELTRDITCIFVLHKITELALDNYGLLDTVLKNDNVITISRVEYFDFMKLLHRSEFVITDGGSNQEELYYMGKPCLIIRKYTERQDGIGRNAMLYGGNIEVIDYFVQNYREFKSEVIDLHSSPSEIIVDNLIKFSSELYE